MLTSMDTDYYSTIVLYQDYRFIPLPYLLYLLIERVTTTITPLSLLLKLHRGEESTTDKMVFPQNCDLSMSPPRTRSMQTHWKSAGSSPCQQPITTLVPCSYRLYRRLDPSKEALSKPLEADCGMWESTQLVSSAPEQASSAYPTAVTTAGILHPQVQPAL